MKYLLSIILLLSTTGTLLASKNYIDEVSQLADDSSLDFTNEVTISVKMYRRANSPSNQGILTKGRTDLSQPMLYGLYFSANTLKFVYANPDGVYFTYTSSSTFPQTNTTIHVAAKYQYAIAASMQLYVDGEIVPGTWSVSPVLLGLVNANNVVVGALNTAAQGISARVTDVALWNAYLTDNQIRLLYNGPKMTPLQIPTGLLIYWAMDNGSEQNGSNLGYRIINYADRQRFSLGTPGPMISDAFTGYYPNE